MAVQGRSMKRFGVLLAAAGYALVGQTATSEAFCGFYVSGSGEKMFADATQVVLMREGTRTVLSMQNDYKGPLADFAMVIPVPVVLHEPDVKTLPKDAFAHTDSLGSPRLVEYWEQNPCPPPVDYDRSDKMAVAKPSVAYSAGGSGRGAMESVKIEAQFSVGEYQI